MGEPSCPRRTGAARPSPEYVYCTSICCLIQYVYGWMRRRGTKLSKTHWSCSTLPGICILHLYMLSDPICIRKDAAKRNQVVQDALELLDPPRNMYIAPLYAVWSNMYTEGCGEEEPSCPRRTGAARPSPEYVYCTSICCLIQYVYGRMRRRGTKLSKTHWRCSTLPGICILHLYMLSGPICIRKDVVWCSTLLPTVEPASFARLPARRYAF